MLLITSLDELFLFTLNLGNQPMISSLLLCWLAVEPVGALIEGVNTSCREDICLAFLPYLQCVFLFQVDPNAKPNKQVLLYQTLLDLLKKEEKCREHIRESEVEVGTLGFSLFLSLLEPVCVCGHAEFD